MDLVNEWLETFQGVLTQPTEFFGNEQRRDGFKYPLKFAALNLILSGLISGASTFAGGSYMGLAEVLGIGAPIIIALLTLVLTPVIGLVGLFISSALIHLVVMLLGGEEGYGETLSVAEYATALQPVSSVVSFIPFLGGLIGFILGLYGIYIQVKGLKSFQKLSTGKAIAAILLPGIIVAALVFLLLILALGAGFMAGAMA